jgi:hypothetical protein
MMHHMKTTLHFTSHRLAALSALLVFLGAGCAAPAPVDTGVRIIDVQQTGTTLKAAVVRGAAHVTIAINRPATMGKLLRGNQPAGEKYEPGVVARNRRGFPFLASSMTPEMVDEANATASTSESSIQGEQLEDLRLVKDATRELQDRPDIDGRYRDDLRSLYFMADSALKGANDMLEGKITPEPTPDICDADPSILAPGEYERLCPSKTKQ